MKLLLVLVFVGGLVNCGDQSSKNIDDTWVEGLQDITDWEIVDRAGTPLLHTWLEKDADQDTLNFADPRDDQRLFGDKIKTKIAQQRSKAKAALDQVGFSASGVSVDDAVEKLLPNALAIDWMKAIRYPNGRALGDDVADTVMQTVFDRKGLTDGVSGVEASVEFPYLVEGE